MFIANQLRYFFLKVKVNKKYPVTFKRWQIVRGDVVKVRAGNDRGKIGKVIRVFRRYNQVVVKGVNLRLKHRSKICDMV